VSLDIAETLDRAVIADRVRERFRPGRGKLMRADVQAHFGPFQGAGTFETDHQRSLVREVCAAVQTGRLVVVSGLVDLAACRGCLLESWGGAHHPLPSTSSPLLAIAAYRGQGWRARCRRLTPRARRTHRRRVEELQNIGIFRLIPSPYGK
jgi:hypothetical protein